MRSDIARGGTVTLKPRHEASRAASTASVRSSTGSDTHSLALVRRVASARSRRSAGGERRDAGLFSADELARLEADHAEGLTAVQIVELFSNRGVRFSEATFRKYVQLGLVPRSRRIGRKGKHRGSLGVYPAKAVRRINAVRLLMDEGRTIEEIQGDLLRFADALETLEEGVVDLFHRFEAELESPRFDTKTHKSLRREIDEARRSADELLKRLDGLSHRFSQTSEQEFGASGAAGSAEELL